MAVIRLNTSDDRATDLAAAAYTLEALGAAVLR